MDFAFDIPDSTDWLATPISGLSRVESALRCQVCKDFFNNPVITSCSHTFCSLCIRRCLSAEGKCPTCRSEDQVVKLRQNWAIDELVDSFKKARGDILDFVRNASATTENGADEEHTSKRRKIEAQENDGQRRIAQRESGRSPRRTRSQGRQTYNEASSTPSAPMVIEDSEDDSYEPSTTFLLVDAIQSSQPSNNTSDDGLVACPICESRMKEGAVFSHLNKCPGPPAQQEFQSTYSLMTARPPERLPTINYPLMKENILRRKLKDLGIPDFGPKLLLQRRHTEWVNLWNANCDSRHPKSKRELLRELDIWERTQGGQAPSLSREQANTIMKKDFDGAAWSAAHGDDYKRLIESAREKRETGISPIPSDSRPTDKENSPTITRSCSELQPSPRHIENAESSSKIEEQSCMDSNTEAQPAFESSSQRIVVEDTAA
ncbi:DNA repair protein rad18 [Uncinocarpus reesii 1704]|uniref:Postreplication repair E3 ubiquitin-protein ligase RAD18 n=1 Tax=Uncinocarpus reesii (strain UAMH 1704) TaxID=336963 RepID=C4JUQ6_UNCRE|nr:DNA repair protein rad18 [Uncinocarpus reesii 1704]EEP80017.1 DNA repair protein rad18 [Uncinocarpus reesii 1704]